MSERPKTIFKYERASMQSLQNLKRQSVYFASPREFNDPYDCTLTVAFDPPTDAEVERLRHHFLSDPNLPPAGRAELERQDIQTTREQLTRYISKGIESRIQDFLSNNGVTCFSERNDHLLMWAHYGGRYGGYCLEFRTEYDPFTKLRKVNYTDEMPRINLCSFIVDHEHEQIMKLYCTKNKDWAYEREWRSRHKESGKPFIYEGTALKAIYFGPNMDDATREIVCLILQGQNPDVEFWKGRRREDRFQVEFDRFTYTSYAEAKKQGLL